MNFSDFVNMLYPIIGDGVKPPVFVLLLTDNIMEKPTTNKDKKKDIDEEYNPLKRKSVSMLEKIFSGSRKLSKKNAGVILAHMDKEKFVAFLLTFSNDAIESVGKDLEKNGVMILDDDIPETCANLFELVLKDCVRGVSTNTDEKIDGRLILLEKLKKAGHYELLMDLENIHKNQEVLNKLVNLLEKYNCISPYPHDIPKYMKELKEIFSSTKFYDTKVTSAVNEFLSTYKKFMDFLVTYYERLKQVGKNEEGEQNEKVIIENREKLPMEMRNRQASFLLAVITIIKLEGELETVAKALFSAENKD